ncbi:small nuclear ribonucleoprotein Sm D3-like [Acinonyx jubatus]|uniref:Small nuclear ribonucleoprotein Sm D3-like n=1 Tax=Acinonyx jubatus TaxID=32536 RepID=A0ABM3PKB9_ACIJB|nr:small nuclear ribonucleoprotein Sm D3-like [Acinonyx jubatus]
MSYMLIKVLHEAAGHIMTCETNTDKMYHGKLSGREDNINCQMSNIMVPYREGPVAQLEKVYIRDIKICFICFLTSPDMLTNVPMLKSMKNKHQGSGSGRGKAAMLKAQVAARGRGRRMGCGNVFQK